MSRVTVSENGDFCPHFNMRCYCFRPNFLIPDQTYTYIDFRGGKKGNQVPREKTTISETNFESKIVQRRILYILIRVIDKVVEKDLRSE